MRTQLPPRRASGPVRFGANGKPAPTGTIATVKVPCEYSAHSLRRWCPCGSTAAHGARSLLYHAVINGYLQHAALRGFEHAHIWVAPPDDGSCDAECRSEIRALERHDAFSTLLLTLGQRLRRRQRGGAEAASEEARATAWASGRRMLLLLTARAPRKAAEVEEFEVGDRVKALFQRGSEWFKGHVVAVNVQHRSLGVEVRSYSIKYDDDDKESNVSPANMRRIKARAAAPPPALPKPPRRAAGGAAARPFQPEEDSEGTPAAPALAQTPATPRPAAPKKRAPRSLDLGPCRPGAQGPKSIFKQPDGPRRKRTRAEEPEFRFRAGDSVWALERPDIKEAAHGTVVKDVPVGASTGKVKWDNPAYPEAELPIAQIEPARSGRRSSR